MKTWRTSTDMVRFPWVEWTIEIDKETWGLEYFIRGRVKQEFISAWHSEPGMDKIEEIVLPYNWIPA